MSVFRVKTDWDDFSKEFNSLWSNSELDYIKSTYLSKWFDCFLECSSDSEILVLPHKVTIAEFNERREELLGVEGVNPVVCGSLDYNQALTVFSELEKFKLFGI